MLPGKQSNTSQGEQAPAPELPEAKPEESEQIKVSENMLTREEYYTLCIDNLVPDYVKMEDKELLVDQILKQIYDGYDEIIRDVFNEMQNDIANGISPEDTIENIVRRLNVVMRHTIRFQRIDNDTILHDIEETRRQFLTSMLGCSEYCDYALEGLIEVVRNVLSEH